MPVTITRPHFPQQTTHRECLLATLEAPYRCHFFHKPSCSRSAGLQTGSGRSASGTARGSPLGYWGSTGTVLQCPHCRRPVRWKNKKSGTSQRDKWASFEMTECLVFIRFDLTVHFGAKHCVCAATLSFLCLKCHLNFAASCCLLQNDKCTVLFVSLSETKMLSSIGAGSLSSVLKCWKGIFFILLYVFFSFSLDRHLHWKRMSQHKKTADIWFRFLYKWLNKTVNESYRVVV